MADYSQLKIIHYPDPRLRVVCERIETFDDDLAALAARMLELMKAAPGVGLAAPQVGVTKRMFVMNATQEPEDDQVFVNPVVESLEGAREGEEGCLSIPDVLVQVRRSVKCRITAQDLKGEPIELVDEELPARIWQHETDHLDGKLILDRMGPADRIATKRALRELEARYKS